MMKPSEEIKALGFKSLLEAELEDKQYSFIIDPRYQWSAWAAPKDSSGNFDHNNALTGDDLMDYVDGEFFPYLKSFKEAVSITVATNSSIKSASLG